MPGTRIPYPHSNPSAASGGSGDVSGPASSTNRAIARYSGTGGKTLLNSSALLDDSGNIILLDTGKIEWSASSNLADDPQLDLSAASPGALLIGDGSGGPGSIKLGSVITLTSGSGSPEGVVTASPGSLYLNTAGGELTSLYVKTSGNGNTGWVGK